MSTQKTNGPPFSLKGYYDIDWLVKIRDNYNH